jgi:hypothetical protein
MEHHHGQVEDKESVATENGYEVWYSDGYGAQYNETILVISMEITWGMSIGTARPTIWIPSSPCNTLLGRSGNFPAIP